MVRFDPKVTPGQPYDPTPPSEHGLLAVELANGNSAVVPVLFDYVPTDTCSNFSRGCVWRNPLPAENSFSTCLDLPP